MIDGKDGKNVMACAHEALSRFGEHPQIFASVYNAELV